MKFFVERDKRSIEVIRRSLKFTCDLVLVILISPSPLSFHSGGVHSRANLYNFARCENTSSSSSPVVTATSGGSSDRTGANSAVHSSFSLAPSSSAFPLVGCFPKIDLPAFLKALFPSPFKENWKPPPFVPAAA